MPNYIIVLFALGIFLYGSLMGVCFMRIQSMRKVAVPKKNKKLKKSSPRVAKYASVKSRVRRRVPKRA